MKEDLNIFIYARLASERLPGKVLKQLNNKTILGIIIEKLEKLPNRLIVLTSDNKTDDELEKWCNQHNVCCVRGSLNNVASRTIKGLKAFPCDGFYRVNADSPFIQVNLLEKAADIYYKHRDNFDLISNIKDRTYPYGISVELIHSKTFFKAYRHFKNDELEHITKYFYSNYVHYKIHSIKYPLNLTRYRFVLDTEEDWEKISLAARLTPGIFKMGIDELIKVKNDEEYLFNKT